MPIRLPFTRLITTMMLTAALAGCSDNKREFVDSDFANATHFFCQKPNFSSSPLQANSYVLYYDPETTLGNIGQFVFMGDYEWNDDVEEANLHSTTEAIVTDNSVLIYLDQLDSDKTLHITIDRKTLDVTFDYEAMECQKVERQEINDIKVQLANEHRAYLERNDKLNKI